MTTTVIETSAVRPPPSSAALSLPLSFLDIIWITFHPIRRLLFYPHPCSESHFRNTLLPNLKHSLSAALRHYLPLSGNLLYPTNAAQNKPLFRYLPGDSVSLTASLSTSDFDELVANHPREADQFYDFAPEMPPPKEDEPDFKLIPVFALKITLFPNRGICVGFANHHAIGDASSIFKFMSAWASIARLGEKTADPGPPSIDRSLIVDPLDIRSVFWDVMRKAPLRPSSFPVPTNRVRASFTFRPTDIVKLKELAIAEKPNLIQVSSFVVAMAYAWTCLLRSGRKNIEEKIEELFIFTVDIRGRVDPPIPDYFGNCLSYGKAGLDRQVAVGEGGFAIAAEAIAEDIKRVNKKGEVLKGAENWMKGWEKFEEWSFTGVSGSPRFDLCGLDFGWGRARKLEVLSIDGESYSISLCKSSDCDGGLEIGLSLPKERMEAFAALFAEGLM